MDRYYDLADGDAETYYSSLDLISLNNGMLNGERTKQVHGIWFNVGRQYGGYSVDNDNEQ